MISFFIRGVPSTCVVCVHTTLSQFSPGSSPSAKDVESAFVYNDLRKGGPQMNGGSKDSTNAGKDPKQHEASAVATHTTTQPVTQTTTTTPTQAAAATPSQPPSVRHVGVHV